MVVDKITVTKYTLQGIYVCDLGRVVQYILVQTELKCNLGPNTVEVNLKLRCVKFISGNNLVSNYF